MGAIICGVITKYGVFRAPYSMSGVFRTKVQELWRRGRQRAYRACMVDGLFEFSDHINPCNSVDPLSCDS